MFVITRCPAGRFGRAAELAEMAPGKPVFTASHETYVAGVYSGTARAQSEGSGETIPRDFGFLKTAKVFVFSGIAENRAFLKTVAELAGAVAGSVGFNDHHTYTTRDFWQIITRATQCEAAYLVTTEKDYVKVAGKIESPIDIVVVGIRMQFHPDARQFEQMIKDKVSEMAAS
jgi:tetraacyldisaccharide 4'-kinase